MYKRQPGYKRILNKERRPYPTKDGFFALLPYTDGNWREFCALVDRPDILQDPRFASIASRLANVEVVYSTLAKISATRTNAEWIALLKDSNVPHGPVNSLEDLLVDEQLKATGFWQEVDHPTEGRLRMPGIPPSFSRTPPEIRRLQPRLGEHSVEVLNEAGFSQAEIADTNTPSWSAASRMALSASGRSLSPLASQMTAHVSSTTPFGPVCPIIRKACRCRRRMARPG